MSDYNAQLNKVENGAATPISDGGNQQGSEQKLLAVNHANRVFEQRATPGNGSRPDPNLRTHQTNILAGIKTRVDRVESGDPRQFRRVLPGGTATVDNGDLANVQTQGNRSFRDRRDESQVKAPYQTT